MLSKFRAQTGDGQTDTHGIDRRDRTYYCSRAFACVNKTL